MAGQLKAKSIVVTGGAGFVGSYLVPALLARDPNCSIKVLDNLQRGFREYVPDDVRVEFINVDLKDLQGLELHFRYADAVFHLASVVGGVEKVFANEGTVFHDTTLINLNVFNLCKRYRASIKRVIYLSTACCYPKHKQDFKFNPDGSVNLNFVKEEDVYPAEPESGYGMAKLIGEQLCEKLLDQHVYHIIRLHNLYGPKMTCDASSQVVPHLIRKTLNLTNSKDNKVEVWGRGEQYRDFIFIKDAICGIMDVYEQDPINVRVIQLGSGYATTVNELARAIYDIHYNKHGYTHGRDIQIVSRVS
jgi:GDP-D-mannose 3',5'-epimerase